MNQQKLHLVRLHMPGLGLELMWLLNRLKTVLIDNKSSPARFSERSRPRESPRSRERLLLKPESQRRRLLEQGAGKGPCCGVFREQVNH